MNKVYIVIFTFLFFDLHALDFFTKKSNSDLLISKITGASRPSRKKRVRKKKRIPRKPQPKKQKASDRFSEFSSNVEKARLSKILNSFLNEKYEETIEHASKLLGHKTLKRPANYYTGLALAKLGLYAGAIHHFGEVVKMGMGSSSSTRQYYQQAVNSALTIADEIKDDSLVPHLLRNVSFKKIGIREKDKFYYNLGKYYYFSGQYAKTIDAMKEVRRSSDHFSRAQYVMGVIYALNKQYKKSLNIFRDLTKLPKNMIYSELIRDKATIALARLFYGFANYRISQHFYEKITDESPLWMTAVFESSWAYYMEEDFNKVLGKLEVINSPFFDDKFIPEFFVLRTVVLLKMCRVLELKPFIVKFNTEYTGLVKPIIDFANKYKRDPKKIYEAVSNYFLGEKNYYGLPERLVAHIGMEDAIYSTYYKIHNIKNEQEKINKFIKDSTSPVFFSQLSKNLSKYTNNLEKQVARAVLGRIQYHYKSLGEHIDRARLVRLEFMSAETNMLEKYMVVYGKPTEPKIKKTTKYVDVPEGYIYWPFENEYWLDELGYHEFRLENMCEDDE